MIGCRAITPKEIEAISAELSIRNRCILVLGIRTGFRINELLSLNIGDVVDESGSIRNTVKVARRNVKGKTAGQSVPLHYEAVYHIEVYLKMEPGLPNEPLFRSENRNLRGNGRLHHSVFRKQLDAAISRAGIQDPHLVSTHSMRKTYAKNLYGALKGDLFKLQRAMRHKSIQSTASYVAVDDEEIGNAIKNVK